MKKPIIIILILLILLAILVIATLLINRPQQQTNVANVTPSPTRIVDEEISTPPLATETPFPIDEETKEHFDEHHNEQFPTSAPLKTADLISLETGIPANWQRAPETTFAGNAQGQKVSPNGQLYAAVVDRTVQISEVNGNTQVRSIPFPEDIQKTNVVWINDQYLMLTEKDTSDRQLDRMYLYNKDTGEKTFTSGSFPAVSRFNLDVNPQVFNNGTDIVFTDNEGQLWNLHLTF